MATKTDLVPIETDEEGMSFTELFLIFWRKRVLITVFTLIGTILGGTTSIILNATSARVSTIVEYQWDGINMGEYPNGTNFEPSTAFTPNVLNSALTQAELILNTNDLRNQIRISPIVPNTILADIESARQRGENLVYYPTTYKYTINASALGITTAQANGLLDALISSFTEDFQQKYIAQTILQNLALNSINDYDYLDQITILSNQNRIIRDAITELTLEEPRAKSFRSSTSQLTFTDVLAQVSLIDQLQIRYTEGLIINNLITKNASLIIDRLQYTNLLNNLELNKKQAFLNQLLLLIANYDGTTSTVIIPGYEGTINTTSVLEAIYEIVIETQEEIEDIRQEISYNTTLIELYQNTTEDTPERQALVTSISNDITVISNNIKTILNQTNGLLSEYNQVLAKNITKVIIPSTAEGGTSLLIPVAIGLVAGGIISLIVVFSQYSAKAYQEKHSSKRKA